MLKRFLPVIVILSLIVLVSVAIFSRNEPQNSNLDSTNTEIRNETVSGTSGAIADTISTMEKPEDALVYTFSEDSNVSYTAKKLLLSKENEDVVGITSDVSGAGWYSASEGRVYVQGRVDLAGLETDNATRDEHVLEIFNLKNATFTADTVLPTLSLGESFTTQVPGKLNINGVEKDVVFSVTGSITETDFTAEGETSVLMSDFGVTPPSLANVFNSADEITLNFSIVGTRLN